MVRINRNVIALFTLILLIITSSCGGALSPIRVELAEKMPVQFMYRQNVYNGYIQYTNKSMILSVDDEKSGDITYRVSGDRCTIKCEGVSQTVAISEMPPKSMVALLYEFFSEWESEIPMEAVDEESYLTKREGINGTVEFRCYTKNDKSYYTLEIR